MSEQRVASLFARTVAKAIADYRSFLRKHLPQADRLKKLEQLNLRNRAIFTHDISLYDAAWRIVHDIERTVDTSNQGYYSYSGIRSFAEYLREYLENYEIERNNQVVHKAQRASKALIEAIQLATLPSERLNEKVASRLAGCNEIIATFGSKEQHDLHKSNLERQREQNEGFYLPLLENFRRLLQNTGEAAAA